MDKIKINNNIAITWRVNMSSASGEGSLQKDKLTLRLNHARGVKTIESFSLEGNVISFVFSGGEQVHTGTYSLTLIDASDGLRSITVDNAFALVRTSNEESVVATDGDYPVSLTSDVLTVKSVANDAALYARVVALEERMKLLEAIMS